MAMHVRLCTPQTWLSDGSHKYFGSLKPRSLSVSRQPFRRVQGSITADPVWRELWAVFTNGGVISQNTSDILTWEILIIHGLLIRIMWLILYGMCTWHGNGADMSCAIYFLATLLEYENLWNSAKVWFISSCPRKWKCIWKCHKCIKAKSTYHTHVHIC